MTRPPRFVLGLGGFIAAILILSNIPYLVPQDTTWRQRLTVTVSTPEGERSGSAVTEVTATDNGRLIWALPEARGLVTTMRGEAVSVEVRPGQWLFALLQGADGGWARATYPLALRGERAVGYHRLHDLSRDAPVPLPRTPGH